MLILTLFDYNKFTPLLSLVKSDSIKIYNLYHPASGISLYEAEQNKNFIKSLFENNKNIVCNDFKTHLKCFNFDLNKQYDVYDVPCDRPSNNQDLNESKKNLLRLMKHVESIKSERWMKLTSEAAITYQFLENRGYKYFGKIIKPTFFLDTYTGRARSTGFSIHGMGSKEDIKPIDPQRDTFVHFDWVSADIRFAGLLSNDKELLDMFNESDPYTYLSEYLGIDRDTFKVSFLASMYNRNYDDPIFGLFPDFIEWLKNVGNNADSKIPVTDIMGRPYLSSSEHNEKAAINAAMQGSVAEAVKAVFSKIYLLDKEVLFSDIYDSIVCSCSRAVVKDVIHEVGKIIYRPFDGILNRDITLPYKISVGNKWCQWKTLKVIR